MLTIVFYGRDGQAAKDKAREIGARRGEWARCYDASAWLGSRDRADRVVIMPDVLGWQRKRIEQVFGDIIVRDAPAMPEPNIIATGFQMTADADQHHEPVAAVIATTAPDYQIGKGPKGRFYARRDGKIVSPGFDTEPEVATFMSLPQKET